MLRGIPSGRPVSVEREVFPKLLERGRKIAVYKGCNYWLDIGTPEKYVQAHRDVFEGKLPLPEINFHERALYSGPGTRISGTAVLRGPVYLGSNVRIGPGAIIGPRVVIGDNSLIGKKCKVANSILWNDVVLENGAELSECILTDTNTVESASKLKHAICTPETIKTVKRLIV